MSEDNKQVAIQNNDGFLVINTLDEALKVADIIAKSSFCPKAFVGKPGDVLVCMQMGREVNLKPLQALQNIAVINGRPTLWGDGMLAVCRQASNFHYVDETFDPSSMTATCKAKRHGEPEVVRTFSQKDAEAARLWGKEGPWKNYAVRMLQMRARGFCLRDTFADVLRGIISKEEAEDYPIETYDNAKVMGNIVEARVEVNECISDSQLDILEGKLVESESDIPAFCKHYGIESVSEAKTTQFDGMLLVLNKKIKNLKNSKAMKELANNKAAPEIDVNDHADFHAGLGEVDTETGEII